MPTRRALVSISGRLSELPNGDALLGVASQAELAASGTALSSSVRGLQAAVSGLSGVLQTGTADVTFAQLSATGTDLAGRITTLSGYGASTYVTHSTFTASGQQYSSASQANATNLSGSLVTTSGALVARDLSVSGALVSRIAAIPPGVQSLAGRTGVVDLAGAGLVSILGGGQSIIISGTMPEADVTSAQLSATGAALGGTIASTGQQAWTAAQANAVNLSGRLTQTGVALTSTIASLSGWAASSTRLESTGAALASLIGASSAGVSTVNGLSGIVSLAGLGSITITENGQTIRISGAAGGGDVTSSQLTQTGVLLGATIDSLSGFSASALNLRTTGSALYGITVGFSGQSDTNYATKVNLASTGQQAWTAGQNNAVNLSGAIALTGSNLNTRINALSGWAAPVATINSVGTSLSGNLATTGSTLDTKINSLSGYSNAAFATAATVASTGQQAWTAAQANALNLSGALSQTGSALIQRDLNISGALQAQIAGANGTQVSVTGGSTMGFAGFTGIGSVRVYSLGSQVIVSGSAAGQGDVTAADLAATGQQAWTAANNNGINLSGNLALTGSTLATRITSLSGFLSTSIASTGQQAWTAANANAVNLSGHISTLTTNLTATGATLISRTDTLTTNLASTGSTLSLRINSLSGFVLNASGALQAQIGVGGVTAEQLASTGQQAWTAANNNGINLSGALTASGIALMQRDLNISGALQAQIAGANGTQVSVTGGSTMGFAGLTGAGSVTVYSLGTTVIVSGAAGGGDVTSADLAATGQQAWTAANNNALNLSGALTQTGSTLTQRINSLSGWAAPLTTVNSIGTSLSGNLTQTGVLLGGRIDTLTTNLQTTGSNLFGIITALSGQANTNYAAKTDLASTGSVLNSRINTLSGFTLGVSGALQAQVGAGGVTEQQLIDASGAIVTRFGTTFTQGGTFYNPDGLPSGNQRIVVWAAPYSCTATNVRGLTLNVSGVNTPVSTALVNAFKNHALPLIASDLNVNTTGAWVADGGLQNTSFSAGDILTLYIGNAVNAPASVSIQVEFAR